MAEDNVRQRPSKKKGRLLAEPGQVLKFADVIDDEAAEVAPDSVFATIGESLLSYKEAARKLLEGKYADQKGLAPLHIRDPCSVFVLRCSDGIFVRYDLVPEGEAKVRCAESNVGLAEVSPAFSDHVIHFPQDPSTYVPEGGGPELVLAKTDAKAGTTDEILRARPLIYLKKTFPDGFTMLLPPARPPCLAAVQNEFDLQMHGTLVPSDEPIDLTGPNAEQFIAHGRFKLPVGWQTIEIYPLLGDEYWKREYAPIWAELDLLAGIVQRNALASTLHGIDNRGATRKQYAELLSNLEALLQGPEETVHQFLKQHPELLCPTSEQYWSKLPFGKGPGKTVSDFVFREPHNDYLLVEIEAPIRELFRKDGQQRQELTHAINQITDWVQYIADNKREVEEKLGLRGISTNPRTLVVIGRSASLTEENRKKLATLQAQQNKLRILTYDDLITSARANLERILGPLSLQGQNVEVYYYKSPAPPAD